MSRLFELGAIVATPGALALLSRTNIDPLSLVRRHARGDWGDLDQEDRRLNNAAVIHGCRFFSSYLAATTGEKVWVIMDAADDFGIRRVTTLLRPEDY